jgi:hypothetical protein
MAEEQPTKVAKLAPEQSPAAASKAVEDAVAAVKSTDNGAAAPTTDAAAPASLTEKKIDLLKPESKEEAKAEEPAETAKEAKADEPASKDLKDAVVNGKEGEEKEEDKTEEKAASEEEPKEETVADMANGAVKSVVNTVKTAVGAEPVK